MKKIIIFLILFGFLISTKSVLAKFPDDLPGPHLMPDSKLYFLKLWYEKIVLFFTFDAVKRAEKYKTFAEKRAYEIRKMIEEGKADLVEKPKKIYQSYLDKAQEILEKAIKKAVDRRKEELKQELEKKIEEIKSKFKEQIGI